MKSYMNSVGGEGTQGRSEKLGSIGWEARHLQSSPCPCPCLWAVLVASSNHSRLWDLACRWLTLWYCPSLESEHALPVANTRPQAWPRTPGAGVFDLMFLSLPQLLFLTGLSLIIGLRKTFSFFFQKHKLKGTSFFLGGVVIVLLRWPLLGMCLETYGFLSLFR